MTTMALVQTRRKRQADRETAETNAAANGFLFHKSLVFSFGRALVMQLTQSPLSSSEPGKRDRRRRIGIGSSLFRASGVSEVFTGRADYRK